MKDLININRIPTVDYIKGAGRYRFIAKCRAGFMTISETYTWENQRLNEYPEEILSRYKKGALQTVEFQPEGSDVWLTVFARVGKRIHLIDQAILADLTVGTINQLWHNTELYSQAQYTAVNATSWASYAYRMNETAKAPQEV